MATAGKVEKKRKRNRKARTEVSPSPSSGSSSPPPQGTENRPDHAGETGSAQKQTRESPLDVTHVSEGDKASSAEEEDQSPWPARRLDPQTAFAEFYLQQSTREFANDLEKLRAAKDFNGEATVGLLVRALRQGTASFTAAEQLRIGAAAAGDNA